MTKDGAMVLAGAVTFVVMVWAALNIFMDAIANRVVEKLREEDEEEEE